MDGKQYPLRLDAFGTNAERMRSHVERRKENPFLFRDSSVDPVNTGAMDKVTRFLSPRCMTMGQQSLLLPADKMTVQESELQFLEQSERMGKRLQQSIMSLHHKQQMQHNILLMQQQQIQQQRQVQLQHQNEQLQQQQSQFNVQQQQRSLRQRSPEKQRQDPNADNQIGAQKMEHNHTGEKQKAKCPESSDNVSVQDLFMQCQNHLDVINACTDLQQTIKVEMKKQAKLDNIICQKLVSKAQRLQQQATFLEKAHAPSWVGPALLELGSQVIQQAEIHHIYTASLIEQCVVIQHSLDGHHELMKSVLAEHSEPKQKPVSLADLRNKGSGSDKRNHLKVGDETRSMTFLQASNIFEGIRKPRMKLLSSLEYQQEQLNATVMHLGQVDSEIEAISNKDDSEGLMWRTQLQKKDLEIRKEFLEARKEQLESDVQFAKMDLSDFEFGNKDSLLEVLNVFRQHRIRYDTTLKQSFQLLKAASVRDINYLRGLTKNSDLDANTELEYGDIHEGLTCKQNDPWSCASKASAKMISITLPGDREHDSTTTPLTAPFSKSTSPQIAKMSSPYFSRNAQEQIDTKIAAIEQTYPVVLSSDSEMSDVQKSGMYSPELKPVKIPTVTAFNVSQFQNLADFNFSRAESSPSLPETNKALAGMVNVSNFTDKTKPPGSSTVQQKLHSFKENALQATDDDSKLIISRYVGDGNVCENQPLNSCFHTGTEDMMVVSRGPKPRRTLGNFENSIDSEDSIHCLYPMTNLREFSSKKDEKRVSHLINKYASGNRGSRSSLGKNWNICKPMVWCGISKSVIRDVSRRKMNRSLKYCKLLTPHNILTEYNENKPVNNIETLMAQFKGHNINNSEILQGQGDHESIACCKQSSELTSSITSLRGSCSSSEVDDSKHRSECNLEHGSKTRTCESVTERCTDDSVSLAESTTSNVSEDVKTDAADSQSLSQVMNNHEQLSGQESRNLNNCEPLKCHVVDAGAVVDREDQMDFEVIQVLCPDSQPRQVRVCAVRPIPSEVDRADPGQIVAKGLTSETSQDPQPRRGLSCKYDNLKVYEITAGQFTVSEVETDSKSRSTTGSNKVDCGNNKRPHCSNFSSQVFPNPDYAKKSDFSSCKNRVYESRPHDMLKAKTLENSATMNCELLPATTSSVGYSTDVTSESGPCQRTVCSEQFTGGRDATTVSVSAEAQIGDPLAVTSTQTQDLLSTEFMKSENVHECPNNLPNTDQFNDKFDEDETLSKTVYGTEEQENNLKLCDSRQRHYKLKDVTDPGSINVQNTLQECTCAKTTNNEEVNNTNRQLTRNLLHQMTKDAANQTARIFSIHRTGTPEDAQVIKRINYKDVEFLVEDELLCRDEIRVESKYEKYKIKKAEMSDSTSEQGSSQIHLHEDSDVDQSHALKKYNQDYFRQMINEESLDETTVFINDPQLQEQNRPLKSSLKKYCVNYATCPDSNSEETSTSNCKYLSQCGVPTLASSSASQLCLQRDSDKNHKCVKQVRFDHRVHYDDNTVTDTLGITISHENQPDVTQPSSTNKHCPDRTNNMDVQEDEILMYSAVMTSSYFTNNCNFSVTDEK